MNPRAKKVMLDEANQAIAKFVQLIPSTVVADLKGERGKLPRNRVRRNMLFAYMYHRCELTLEVVSVATDTNDSTMHNGVMSLKKHYPAQYARVMAMDKPDCMVVPLVSSDEIEKALDEAFKVVVPKMKKR